MPRGRRRRSRRLALRRRGPEFAVIHRPRYDDWSLPKGKLDPGEDFEQAAVREVQRGDRRARRARRRAAAGGLPRPQGALEDRALLDDGRRRRRRRSTPNDEVDEVRWLPAPRRSTLLSYERDREVLAAIGWREPRALPRARRRLGAARRAGRHADGRRRDRGDGRLHALGPQRQLTAARSPRRRRPTRSSTPPAPTVARAARRRPARRRLRAVDDRADDALRGDRDRARATRWSAPGSTTTPTSGRGYRR